MLDRMFYNVVGQSDKRKSFRSQGQNSRNTLPEFRSAYLNDPKVHAIAVQVLDGTQLLQMVFQIARLYREMVPNRNMNR